MLNTPHPCCSTISVQETWFFLPSLFTEEFSIHQARSSSPQTSHSPSFPLIVPSSSFALFFSQNLYFQTPPSNFSSPLFFLFFLKSLSCHKNPTPTLQILIPEKNLPQSLPIFLLPLFIAGTPSKTAPLMPCFSFFFYPSLSLSCKLLSAPLFLVQQKRHPQPPP